MWPTKRLANLLKSQVPVATLAKLAESLCYPGKQAKKQEPGLLPALVVMRFVRRHPGAQKGGAANYGGSLFEPHH